jgi:hypothetical protein
VIVTKANMQSPLFCASCTTPLAFKVPELAGDRWYANCTACGKATALEATTGEPEDLATFSAVGVHSVK